MIRRILQKAPEEEAPGVQPMEGQLSSLCVPFSVGRRRGNDDDHNNHLFRLQNTSTVFVSYNFHKNHLGPASLSLCRDENRTQSQMPC